MVLLLIVLTILSIGICVLLIWINQLDKKIDKLKEEISDLKYQNDNILCDINIVYKNVLDTYGILVKLKEEKIRNG